MSSSWISSVSSASEESASDSPKETGPEETGPEEMNSFETASQQTTSFETTSEETVSSEDITYAAQRRSSFIEGLLLLNSEFDDENPEQYRADALHEWLQDSLKHARIGQDIVDKTECPIFELDWQRYSNTDADTGVWLTFEGIKKFVGGIFGRAQEPNTDEDDES